MHPKNFVICDVEQEYAESLTQAISLQKELGFQMYLFQDAEQLEKFSEQKTIHILLMGEDFPASQRLHIKAKERYVLVKGETENLLPEEKALFKYQSCDRILGVILGEGEYGKSIDKDIVKRETGNKRLIGIYSPVHRIGKTQYALELGKELAKKGSVLYLNLKAYAGGDCYFPGSTGQNLGDLLYYIRQENSNLGFRISSLAGRIGELDYVPPMSIMQDLRAVEEQEWIHLVEVIFSQTVYQTVILDLGDHIQGLYGILRECHTVYTLYGDDSISQAKLKQYAENLRMTGYESVLEHTIQRKVNIKAGE